MKEQQKYLFAEWTRVHDRAYPVDPVTGLKRVIYDFKETRQRFRWDEIEVGGVMVDVPALPESETWRLDG
jgi:hypothetical protein